MALSFWCTRVTNRNKAAWFQPSFRSHPVPEFCQWFPTLFPLGSPTLFTSNKEETGIMAMAQSSVPLWAPPPHTHQVEVINESRKRDLRTTTSKERKITYAHTQKYSFRSPLSFEKNGQEGTKKARKERTLFNSAANWLTGPFVSVELLTQRQPYEVFFYEKGRERDSSSNRGSNAYH